MTDYREMIKVFRECYARQINTEDESCAKRYKSNQAEGKGACEGCECHNKDNDPSLFNIYVAGFGDGLREAKERLSIDTVLRRLDELHTILSEENTILRRLSST